MFQVYLTEQGVSVAQKLKDWPIELMKQMDILSDEEKAQYIYLNLKVLKGLESKGKVSPSRMCLTCSHFSSQNEKGPEFNCSFYNEKLKLSDLRTDCVDHSLGKS